MKTFKDFLLEKHERIIEMPLNESKKTISKEIALAIVDYLASDGYLDGNSKVAQELYFSNHDISEIKKRAAGARMPYSYQGILLSSVISVASPLKDSFYFDDADFVKGDKTIITNCLERMPYREFITKLKQEGIL